MRNLHNNSSVVENSNDKTDKFKLIQRIENKFTRVSNEEIIKKSDVTLEDKRKLTCMIISNLLAYLI